MPYYEPETIQRMWDERDRLAARILELERDRDAAVEALHGERRVFRRERAHIRQELIGWMVGNLDLADVGLFNRRRVVAEIDRICPEE